MQRMISIWATSLRSMLLLRMCPLCTFSYWGCVACISQSRDTASRWGNRPFDMAQDEDYRWLGALSNQLLAQSPEENGQMLTLFDLRKLRYRGLDMPVQWE